MQGDMMEGIGNTWKGKGKEKERVMGQKRVRDDDDDDDDDNGKGTHESISTLPRTQQQQQQPQGKRIKHYSSTSTSQNHTRDTANLASFPNEILIRILLLLPLPALLTFQSTSRKFRRVGNDSQVWRGLYCGRFVRLGRSLSVSMRQGTTDGSAVGGMDKDGRIKKEKTWKERYRLAHNWAAGRGRVGTWVIEDEFEGGQTSPLLAQLMGRLVVTADSSAGLRAWDVKSKICIASAPLGENYPTCLAVDKVSESGRIAVGFADGTFGLWKLCSSELSGKDRASFEWVCRSRRPEREGEGVIGGVTEVDAGAEMAVMGMAYAHPHVLTISVGAVLAVYAIEVHPPPSSSSSSPPMLDNTTDYQREYRARLLTSLKSHTARAPLALSLRISPSSSSSSSSLIASVVHTYPPMLIGAWAPSIQEIHLSPQSGNILKNRFTSAPRIDLFCFPPCASASNGFQRTDGRTGITSRFNNYLHGTGPRCISYAHPYLLVARDSSSLASYLITSTDTDLRVRETWCGVMGHTAGVAGVAVGARGRAVSVTRTGGAEVKVWELEGRKVVKWSVKKEEKVPHFDGVVVRGRVAEEGDDEGEGAMQERAYGKESRWVGFDDELAVVVRQEIVEDGESRQGTKKIKTKKTLVVYDFA